MGLFLAMSGIAGASREAVELALGEYTRSKQGHFRPAPVDPGSPGVAVICDGDCDRLTVVYPGNFSECDQASAFLSRRLNAPVFSLHIQHEEFWMYVLYVTGEETDWFNPIPTYWSDSLKDDERARWAGNADVVAKNWPGITPDRICRYLTEWDLDDQEPRKAYSEDEYDCDSWQLADFMMRLGLRFPIDALGDWHGLAYEFVAGT